jgi:large subunit ribosomal protein L31
VEEFKMKPDIHPDYHEINVVMTDGTKFTTRSTWGKPGDTMQLDVDSKSHQAWTGKQTIVDTAGQIGKFTKRFGNIGTKKS